MNSVDTSVPAIQTIHRPTEIRIARKQQHLTTRSLAELVGVSRQAISDWERGNYPPSAENWFLLKQILGLAGEIRDYFGREGMLGRKRLYHEGDTCCCNNCNQPPVALGMCQKHYQRARHHRIMNELQHARELHIAGSPNAYSDTHPTAVVTYEYVYTNAPSGRKAA